MLTCKKEVDATQHGNRDSRHHLHICQQQHLPPCPQVAAAHPKPVKAPATVHDNNTLIDTKQLDALGAQEQHCKGSWPLFLGQQCEYAQLQVKSHNSRPSQLNAAPVQFRQGCSCSRPCCQDTQLPETRRHVACQSSHKPPYSRIALLFTKLKAQRKHSPPSFPERLVRSDPQLPRKYSSTTS